MPSLVFKGFSGSLPTSVFEYVEDGQKIGLLQVRHQPSAGKDVPQDMASHMYYEIEPAYRGKGHGKRLFGLGLEEARKVGLTEVIATCDADNVISKHIIESWGGVFEKELMNPATGKPLLKYRIALA